MTRTDLMAELDYMSSIAKDGANAPLLGGPIGLMWGLLLIPTLIFHGLTMMGKTPLPVEQVGAIWAAYGVIGTILNIMLGRRIQNKPGAGATVNKIGAALGASMGIIIFTYAISAVYLTLSQNLPMFVYATIMVLAFALSCMNLAVLARITGKTYLKVAALIAGLFMVVCLLSVTSVSSYFLAALGVLFTQVIPGLIEIREETSHAG